MPPVLREFCAAVLFLTVISVVYCLIMAFVLHRHYPYVWPFYIPAVRFNDFTIYYSKFTLFHDASFFTTGYPFTYPSPVALVYEAFYKWGGADGLLYFKIFMGLAFSIPLMLFGRALRLRALTLKATIGLVGCVALSWPALLIVDRANMEVVVWVFLALATWAYAKGKFWAAAGLFGIAASLKLFPFVYLAMFLTRGKYRQLLFGIFMFVMTTLVSLAILGPTIPIAYHGIADGLRYFHDAYMSTFLGGEGGVDHSPLAFYKAVVAILTADAKVNPHHAMIRRMAIQWMVQIYIPLMAIGGTYLYFVRIRKMPWLNQLLVLTIASIFFTPFSGDGTLVHLYYSFALCCFLAIDAQRRGVDIPGLKRIFLCFAYLLAVESFIIFQGFRFEGQAKCIVVAILLISAFRFPLGPPPDSEADTALLAYPDSTRVPNPMPAQVAA